MQSNLEQKKRTFLVSVNRANYPRRAWNHEIDLIIVNYRPAINSEQYNYKQTRIKS